MAVILRVRTVLNYGSGGPGLATHYFAPGTIGGSNADAADVATRVRNFFLACVGLCVIGDTFQVQSDVAAIEATTGALTGLFTAGTLAVVTGTGAGSRGPIAAMALVRSRTNVVLNGRLLRGRQYFGPMRVATVDSQGRIVASDVATLNVAAAAIIPAAATTSAPAVWHRPTLLAAGGHALITSYSTWAEFAVLRSRRDA
jgi:hypothetical protein